MRVARRCLVSGRVHGVFYRASAQQRALGAGISGYARNLANGTVEVLACGEEATVREFIQWLWQGPAAAKVTDVQVEAIAIDADAWPRGFTTS
jgi:acylphosphatase